MAAVPPSDPAPASDPAPSADPSWPTVVFDLDGTLVDTIGLIVDSYHHAFETVLGRREDEARIRAWIGRPLQQCFAEASPEHAEALFAAYSEWNAANTDRLVKRYAGVDRLVADLAAAGVTVAVATSKRREPAARALQLTGLDTLIPVIVTQEDTPAHKPDPAPLLLAVSRAGGDPQRAAYVGDAVVDVLAAQAAGMTAIGVLWGAGDPEAIRAVGPAAVATTVPELRHLLLP
ncbi:MAG TPA: HAD-IA family hydrolase [Dermatophilaceae bacterium]|nr:HAD-IA family hydrolase [Dermatophilaceae bacterium]